MSEHEQKKKKMTMSQWIAFGVIMFVLLVVLIILVSNLVAKLRQDWDGFATDMQKVCDYYHIAGIEPNGDSIFKMTVDSDIWNSMTTEKKLEYCQGVYKSTCSACWNNKIINSPQTPWIYFYTGAGRVAEIEKDVITVLK